MQTGTEQILPLVELIYDAAVQPKQWRPFTDALCALMHSRNCNFHAIDINTGKLQFIHNTIPKILVQLYLKQFHPKNPFYPRALPLAYPGTVLLSHEIIPPAEFERTDFRKYMRVIGLYHAIHLTVLREDNIVSGLAVARPKKAGCYSPEEGYWLRLLFPHLQRAFRIGRLLAQLQLDRELLSKAMNRLPQGAVIVNAAGQVIYFNQAAQKIFAANDGLTLNHEARLQTPRTADDQRLHHLIASASRREKRLSLDSGGVIQLERPSGQRALALLIAPLNLEISYLNFQQPTALVFIHDPAQQMEPVETRLQRLYDLTPTEAHVALVRVQGKSVTQVSHELGVSPNTTKTHLKRIHHKTGTRRHSELVKLLLNSPAALKHLDE